MKARRLRSGVVALAAASAATGCGIANPYAHQHTREPTLTQSSDGPREPVPASNMTVRAALRRYALISVNWTSKTLATHEHQLSRLAVGGARAQALQTAASYGAGSSLQHSRVANRGQITSIAAGQGPRRGWWLITTQEKTTGSGDYSGQPTQAHLYAARLSHTPRGWKVSTWSPQN